jgi:hypothetical protein
VEIRNEYKILVGEPEVKRPLGRPTRKWEDNIKTSQGNRVWAVDWLRIGTGGGLL